MDANNVSRVRMLPENSRGATRVKDEEGLHEIADELGHSLFGPVATLNHPHGILGRGYRRIEDAEADEILRSAEVEWVDDVFVGFHLWVGTHGPSRGGRAFVLLQNQLKDEFHLLIEKE